MATRIKQVLIIDAFDEREMYAEALRAGGFTVRTAKTAAEGLVDLEAFQPDVVVQGMALPDLSGLDLVRRIHSRKRRLPVIALTGFTDQQTLARIRAAGFASIKIKPCLPSDLIRAVARLAVRARGY